MRERVCGVCERECAHVCVCVCVWCVCGRGGLCGERERACVCERCVCVRASVCVCGACV